MIGGLFQGVKSLTQNALGGAAAAGGFSAVQGLLGGGGAAPAPGVSGGGTSGGGGASGGFDPVGTVFDLVTNPLGLVEDVVGSVTGSGGQQDVVGFGRGNGQYAYRTIVERLRLADGQVQRISVHPGQPYMMAKDVSIMKQTLKKSAKLAKRIPRKTVKESKLTQLRDAAVDKALRDVNTDDGHCHK